MANWLAEGMDGQTVKVRSTRKIARNLLKLNGTPGQIRTADLLLRRRMAPFLFSNTCMLFVDITWTQPEFSCVLIDQKLASCG